VSLADISTMRHILSAWHRDDRGSIPVAMVLVTFVLAATVALGSLLAWQIATARSEHLATTADWALESAMSQAVSNVGIAGQSLTNIPTSTPTAWTETSNGDYYWRYWVTEHSGGPQPMVAVITEVQLTSATGEAQPLSGTNYRLVEYLTFDAESNQWRPSFTVSPTP